MVKCPICKKDSIKKYFPFCSNLCKMNDLYAWLNEEYFIEVKEKEDGDSGLYSEENK